jgi:hypothetical protein
MGEFVTVALAFPTVLFSFLLVVVIGYWVLVLVGAVAHDDAPDGLDGALAGIGLGGVPVTVALSLLIGLSWFASLAGTVPLRAAASGPVLVALSTALLVAALAIAWLGTRLLAAPLRRLFPTTPAASRNDFVGRLCVIRTGRVGPDFGQAEVTAPDGSSAVVQVRRHPGPADDDGRLTAGSTALIYDLDADSGFFWVTPYPSEQHPPTKGTPSWT